MRIWRRLGAQRAYQEAEIGPVRSSDRDLIAVMGVGDGVESLSQSMMLFGTVFEESTVSRANSSSHGGEEIGGMIDFPLSPLMNLILPAGDSDRLCLSC